MKVKKKVGGGEESKQSRDTGKMGESHRGNKERTRGKEKEGTNNARKRRKRTGRQEEEAYEVQGREEG